MFKILSSYLPLALSELGDVLQTESFFFLHISSVFLNKIIQEFSLMFPSCVFRPTAYLEEK